MDDQEPIVIEGHRVLGVVPGIPPGGERKVLPEEEPVMEKEEAAPADEEKPAE